MPTEHIPYCTDELCAGCRPLTGAGLRRLASWIRDHGLTPMVVDGAVSFVCHDRQLHTVTTLQAAREALGY